jgi:cobalt-zinc-cadmium resistance protein CzcA
MRRYWKSPKGESRCRSNCSWFVLCYIIHPLGGEFIPTLDEGDVATHLITISTFARNRRDYQSRKKSSKRNPEIKMISCKIGSAETPTDPPVEAADMISALKNKKKKEWTSLIQKKN